MGSKKVRCYALVTLLLLAVLAGCAARPVGVVPAASPSPLSRVTPTTPRATDDASIAEFIREVPAELAYYHIPGAAVAIVRDGRIAHAQGFGVADVATGAAFTPETQFRTGSTAKSMTSLMLAQLVDQGRLEWDTPVVEIMPRFTTNDPELTARITVADLMGMATGLENDALHSLTWEAWTVDDLFAAIGGQKTAGPYHRHYSYNNELYAAAGYVGLAAAGVEPSVENYTAWMRDHVTGPIGMTSAVLTDGEALTDDAAALTANHSRSYEVSLLGGLETPSLTPDAPVGVIGPAGGWWMSIEDMARYLITQLNGGVTPDGRRIVSAENLAVTWQPGVSIPDQDLQIVTDPRYGMGWIVGAYRGVPLRFHGGGWKGYTTMMAAYPQAKAGLVLFTNHSLGSAAGIELMLRFAELLGGLEPQIVAQVHGRVEADLRRAQAQTAGLPPYVLDLADAAPLVGQYEDGWRVELRDRTLWLVRTGWEFLLYPLSQQTGRYLIGNQFIGSPATFRTEGDAVRITVRDLGLEGAGRIAD